jgi:succinyl-CoA synthetase beta subunit
MCDGSTGTNVTEAKKIIETSGLRVVAANDLDDAGEKAVAIASILDKVHLNI